MKEMFDPKTEDIFLFLSPIELGDLFKGISLRSFPKRVAFFLFAQDLENDEYIKVNPVFDVPAHLGDHVENHTNYFIYLSRAAYSNLKEKGVCGDRYLGTTGGQKVHVFLGEPGDIKLKD